MPADPQHGPRTPLDDSPLAPAELEALRARLTTPQWWLTPPPLTLREETARLRMGPIRRPDDIRRLEQEVRGHLAKSVGASPGTDEWDNRQYYEGILAAVLWAIGRSAETPVTGRPLPRPNVNQMLTEADEGRAVGERRQKSARWPEYGIGVETTLLWICAEGDDRPC
ncbi:hypothetical protein ACFQ08_17915 [Streptosporangium algeriense]|uniref:Uncharacterized protein n=1 Tax=Streptosporangium algeriense TaxID=1682748 RepID=A0ABW3DRG3_9ACTN